MTIIQKLQSALKNPNFSVSIKDYINRTAIELQNHFFNLNSKNKIQINNYVNLLLSNSISEERARQCLAQITFIISRSKNMTNDENIQSESPRYAKVKSIINRLRSCISNYEDDNDRQLAKSALISFQSNVNKLTDSEINRIYILTQSSFIPNQSLIMILRICNKTQFR